MNYLKGLGFFVLVVIFPVNALAVSADKVGKPVANSPIGSTNEPQLNQPSDSKVITQVTTKKNNLVPARISRCPKPEYPSMAMRFGMEGSATVDVFVDENGKVSSTKLSGSSGFEILDKTSIEYFYQCEFTPAIEDGKPQAAWARKRMVWKIEDEDKEGSVLGQSLSGNDEIKPFSNIRRDFNRDCGDLVQSWVESINAKFTNQKISKSNVCSCMDSKIFSDKILMEFFDKTTKQIRDYYDSDKMSNYFLGRYTSAVYQCVSEELTRGISVIDVKKK